MTTLSIVQHKSVITEGASMPITMDSVPTAGNLLVCLVYDVVNDVSFSSFTLTAGWTIAPPLTGLAQQWVANNANFGESYILYKFVAAEGATFTPVATCTNGTPHVMTVFEITNPGAAWSTIFRTQDSFAPAESAGEFLLAGTADSAEWGTDGTHSTLVLMQFVDAGALLLTSVGNIGSALSTVSHVTSASWPFSIIKNGVVRAFSELLPINTDHVYSFGARLNPVASVIMVGLYADVASGGTSPTDIIITTTVLESSASPARFLYTTLT